MKISIVGTGYVGLVTGACFANMGNEVICVDIDKQKIENLKKAIIPIYEPGLESLVKNAYENQSLSFTTNIKEALENSNIIFIAVGTPMKSNKDADLSYVKEVAKSIGKLINKPLLIVNKSTVPVGTADLVKNIIKNELKKRNKNIKFSVISNPEFLKEGAAVEDFMKPDRVIVGSDDKEDFKIMQELYEPFMKNHNRLITMDAKSAEMTKYAANAMLATKISFMNEIANICEYLGANVNDVRNGIGSDSRIGYSFIYPGCGYGGSCFPKDVQALIHTAKKAKYKPKILLNVEKVNDEQKYIIADKIIKHFGENLKDKQFGIWGLAFKPNTDDMREASSIIIINELTKRGAKILAYDPKAINEAKNKYLKDNKNIIYVKDKYSVLKNSDALVLITEWSEFRSPDFKKISTELKEAVIFDGRNQYNKQILENFGIKYYQIGVRFDL